MAKLIEITDGAALPDFLNAQQRAAVLHDTGPLLVIAGAGTGKTRVITERIRYLLETQPDLAGEQILGLTFTEKAAGEMKWRVSQTVGERGQKVQLSTFHAFCATILSELEPATRVLDQVDHWILLRRNLRLLQLDRFRRLSEPGQFLGDFERFFSRCQDELVTPDIYQAYADSLSAQARRALAPGSTLEPDVANLLAEEAARQQEIARAFRASEQLLREGRLLTFGSMILDTVRQIDADPEFAARLRERFRYILVDEFQDTNIAQLELLWRLAAGHRNIVAVGDDDQAIYRFRGASFGSFQIFIQKFADPDKKIDEKSAADPPVLALTQNYRSSERVLRVANQVISLNEKSDLFPPKKLSASKPLGEKVRIVELVSAAHEARWVTGELARLHAAKAEWRSFAVLYRSHTHRNLLVQELGKRRIPFVIRNLSILENTLVRDLIAYLRLIATPSDDVAVARVLAMPGWKFTAADLVRLAERAGISRGALWDALVATTTDAALAKGLSEESRAADLLEFVTRMRKRARKLSAAELFAELAGELDLGVQAGRDFQVYHKRLAEFIREWEPKSETKRLAEFVEYLDLFQQAGGQISLTEEMGKDAVQLMTVHAAKGLEFDHVFILRLTRGAFPIYAKKPLLEFPDDLMKEARPRGDFHIQEERRLFYVALTRARERLTLTAVVDNKRNKPSTFLDDIIENAALTRRDIERLAPPPESDAKEISAGAEESPANAQSELFRATHSDARVFSEIAKWAREFHPPVPEPLQLSASAIDTYKTCPQKYLFSNLWRLRSGPHAAMSFGSVMHTTIKHFLGEVRKGRAVPFEEVITIFEREWTPAGFEDDYQQEGYKQDGIDQLRVFHSGMIAAPQEIEAQEKTFELPMEDNIVVTGRIDQINRFGEGHREIVDYKTGRPRTAEDAKKDSQLSIYALAATEILEFVPARLVFHYLADNSRVETSREEKDLKKTRLTILEAAANIRAGDFAPDPGLFKCRNCAFRPICPAHEQQMIRSES